MTLAEVVRDVRNYSGEWMLAEIVLSVDGREQALDSLVFGSDGKSGAQLHLVATITPERATELWEHKHGEGTS